MKAGPASPSVEFLRLPQSSLSPLQLQHTVPSPRAGTVAFVHINPTQPLSCKESLSGFSQPTYQGPAGTDSRLPSGDVHVSSWSHPMPSGPLAAFLSLHRVLSHLRGSFLAVPQPRRFFLQPSARLVPGSSPRAQLT